AGKKVLVFSKTAGFRHDSIPEGIAALKELGGPAGITVDATEEAGQFTTTNLAKYDAVAFLSTTGDVLNADQQKAFESYVKNGGAVGSYFDSHPAIQKAAVRVDDHDHPSTAHLDDAWERTDEWYNYRTNPREQAKVLATLDETTYQGGTMKGDHPIAWCQNYGG